MKITMRIFSGENSSRQLRASIFVLSLLLVSIAVGQPVGEKVGPQFPFITSSARGLALGDATTAIIDDFSGFGSNPGVLGLMKTSVIDYSVQRVQKGVTFEHLGLSYKATTVDAIAFAIDVLHYGGTDFYSDGNVRKLGFEMRTGLAYGRLLSDQFSMGINLQAITSTTDANSVWAFASDIGLAYAPGKYLRYALSLRGVGSDYKIGSQILQTDIFTSRISRVLSLGVAIDYPFSDQTERILVSFQNEKILGEDVILYKLGVEYFPFWSPMFRAGIRGGFIARDPDFEPRFGLGLGYSQFSLDYGYRYTRRYIQPSHIFTLTFSW